MLSPSRCMVELCLTVSFEGLAQEAFLSTTRTLWHSESGFEDDLRTRSESVLIDSSASTLMLVSQVFLRDTRSFAA